MTPAVRVTIVIPHYNGRRFLRETVQAVESQTFQDWEIIIVDDGSDEEHRLGSSSFTNPRIRVVNQRREGAAAATQRGIDDARGAYVAFLDQDDLWLPSKLERGVSMLDAHDDIDLTFSGYRMIDEAGRPVGPNHLPPQTRFSVHDLFVNYAIGPTASAMTRLSSAIDAGPVNRSLTHYYDYEFFLRISRLRPNNVAATQAPLTQYRRHAGQLSADIDEMREEWQRVVNAIAQLDSASPGTIARAQSNMNRYFAYLEYEAERFGAGCKGLTRAFHFAPVPFLLNHRNWLMAAGCLAGLVLPRSVRLAAERFIGTRV